jgi:hypothetical protein
MPTESMRLAIFAKRGTNEKFLIPCFAYNTPFIMRELNERFGPDWVVCDDLQPNEGIMFTDAMTYKGYSPKIPRYSNSIFKLTTPLA